MKAIIEFLKWWIITTIACIFIAMLYAIINIMEINFANILICSIIIGFIWDAITWIFCYLLLMVD